MSQQNKCSYVVRVVSKGCDWLTKSCKTEAESKAIVDVFHDVSRGTFDERDLPEKWWFQGYRGLAYDHLKCGVRANDEAIIILSGDLAREWIPFENLVVGKPTRLDLQVTVQVIKPQPTLASEVYKSMLDQMAIGARKRNLRFISSPTGDTTYIGSRKSATMLRVYDKAKDIPFAERGEFWRYEVEFKKGKARVAWDSYQASGWDDLWVIDQVHSEFRERGIPPVFEAGSLTNVIEEASRVSSVDAKLSWMKKCVSPVVARLLNAGFEKEVLEALKLSHIAKKQEVL